MGVWFASLLVSGVSDWEVKLVSASSLVINNLGNNIEFYTNHLKLSIMSKEIKVCNKCQQQPKPHESLWVLSKEARDEHKQTNKQTRILL